MFCRVLSFIFYVTVVVKSEDCPSSCRKELIAPSCGSDGKLYYNECDLRRLNCNNEVVKVEKSKCVDQCVNQTCTREFNPRCGSDGEIYGNRCMFLWQTCSKPEEIIEEPLENCVNKKCLDNCLQTDDKCKQSVANCKRSWGLLNADKN